MVTFEVFRMFLANNGITGQRFVRDEEKHLAWYRACTIPHENQSEWYKYAKECAEPYGEYYPSSSFQNED